MLPILRHSVAGLAAGILCLGSPPALAGPPVELASPIAHDFTGRSLVVADLDGASGFDLAGVSGANVVITARQPGGSYSPPLAVAMGVTLRALGCPDLDGDGRSDLVAISNVARSLVSRRNLGALTFGAAGSLALPGPPTSLALGDLDGNGHADAAVAIPDSGRIAVSLADATGALQPVSAVPAAGAPWFVAIADFTGDGHPDLLTASRILTLVVSVLPGDGAGHFGAPIVTSVSLSYRFSIGCADLDGDGDLDLAAYHDGGVSWLANLGAGAFGDPVSAGMPAGSYGSSYDPGQFAIGDLDGDGHPDLAIPARRSRSWNDFHVLSVLVNRGDGSFFPPAHHHVGTLPTDAALADLDGDGALDAVVTTATTAQCCTSPSPSDPHHAYVLHGSGHGRFEAHLELEPGAWMPVRRAQAPADLAGTSNGRLLRARNRGHGTFLAPDDLGRGEPWRAADLDGDGDDELIVVSGDSLWVLRALGGGTFAPPASIAIGLTPRDLADFDGDGHLDLLAHDATLRLQVLPGDGGGTLGAPLDGDFALPEDLPAQAVRAADADGDGRADLLYLRPIAATFTPGPGQYGYRTWLHVAPVDAAGHFAPADSFELEAVLPSYATSRVVALELGDFDGDHVGDVAMQSSGCGNDVPGWWGWWRGLGGGAFAASGPATGAGNSPCALAAADLNGDGLDDLARTNGNGGHTMSVTIHTAFAGGALVATASALMGDYPHRVFLADMDGDGVLDVVTRSSRYGSASIRRNTTWISPPVPSLLALVSSRVDGGVALLEWFAAEAPASATVERSTGAGAWSALTTLAPDGGGTFRYADRALPEAERAGYRLRWRDEDGEHLTAESWLELPRAAFALRGAWPNPAPSAPEIALDLPRTGDVVIDVFDIGGRRVAREHRAGLAAGPQRVTVAASLPAGVYLARASYAGRSLETRFVVVR